MSVDYSRVLSPLLQVSYVECVTPHGKSIDPGVHGSKLGDLPIFFGNLTNEYGKALLACACTPGSFYVEPCNYVMSASRFSDVDKAFAMGFDGLYHDEFGGTTVR